MVRIFLAFLFFLMLSFCWQSQGARYGAGERRSKEMQEAAIAVASFAAPPVLGWLGKGTVKFVTSAKILIPGFMKSNKFLGWKFASQLVKDENLLVSATAVKVSQITGLAAGAALMGPPIS